MEAPGDSHRLRADDSRNLAAIAYFLVALSGIFVYIWRREDPFVRFHALQSILGTVAFWAFGAVLWVLGSFPIFGFLYAYLLRIYLVIVFFYWLFLMVRAKQGDRCKIPYVGQFIERELL